jgi:nucleoside diphosphate kinase
VLSSLADLFARRQAGFTVYSPDGAQSRLWGNLDHAIQGATGFKAIYRQWIIHDVNSITRFYNDGGEDPPPEADPEAAARRYDEIPVETLQYGHLVMKLFLSGPSLLTVWRGDNAVSTLLALKGKTHPSEADTHTIRGRFWCDNAVCNLVHVSDNDDEAQRELRAVNISLDTESAPLPLIEPVPPSTRYVAHSGIAVLCDVVNRLLLANGDTLEVTLPPSGDAKETNRLLTGLLRETAARLPGTDIRDLIDAYLTGDVVAVTPMLRRLPVTKWEHFIIQCGAITRHKWTS